MTFDNATLTMLIIDLVPPVAADYDEDGDVDLTDFAFFAYCFNGPNRPPAGTE